MSDKHKVIREWRHGALWATCCCGAWHMGSEAAPLPAWIESHRRISGAER